MARRNPLARAALAVLLFAGMAAIVVPMYLTVITSLKTQQESTINFFSVPDRLNLDNFAVVLEKSQFWQFLFNSTFISVVSVGLIILLVPMAAYAIARNTKNRYYSSLYLFVIVGIFVPFQVIMLPISVFMTKLGLNNLGGVVLFYLGVSFMKGIFLLTKFIRAGVPLDLEEAAHMDGASVSFTYFRVVVPLIMPMVSTIMIVDFLWIWNDFMLPLILLNRSQSNWTLPLFQYNFKTQYTFEYNLAFAAILLSSIPILVVYAFAQRYIISGLSAGSVKG